MSAVGVQPHHVRSPVRAAASDGAPAPPDAGADAPAGVGVVVLVHALTTSATVTRAKPAFRRPKSNGAPAISILFSVPFRPEVGLRRRFRCLRSETSSRSLGHRPGR